MPITHERTARQVAFTLAIKSPKIFEGMFLNNGCLVLMGVGGRVRVVKGGNRFDERTRLGQNTNVDFRDAFAPISTTFQNNVKTAYYGQATISGAAPVNFVEEDQNAGSARIESLSNDVMEECMNTFPNKIGDALLAAAEGANDPLSLRVQLPATAYGSQTQTTGNIVRSDYPGADKTKAWQTQYTNDSADIAVAAGIATVYKFVYTCAPGGGSLREKPDICLTTAGVLAKASGGADVLRRFGVNDTLVKYGFDNLKINGCALIADRNVEAKKGYFINTNYARIQILGGAKTKKTMNLKVIGDGATSVPLQVRPPVEHYSELNYAVKMYLTMNLTFGALRNHGLMDNLTEA